MPELMVQSKAQPVFLVQPANDSATSGAASSALTVRSTLFTHLGYQQLANATLAASTAMTVPAGATVARGGVRPKNRG